jgi:hypothetical protein
MHLVGVHRLADCIPFLRQWEEIEWLGCSTSSRALERATLEVERLRPIVHHSLRLLGEEPRGFAAYHFIGRGQEGRLPAPECLADRYERSRQVTREMSAQQVLALLGAPDHIGRRTQHKSGPRANASETWEYDFRRAEGWVTLIIAWWQGLMVALEEIPSDWATNDERVFEILNW